MNTDTAFLIGSTHEVCQDYVCGGESLGRHYIIVSDGCSGSPDSDFGSRVICKTAERLLSLATIVDGNLPDAFGGIPRMTASNGESIILSMPCVSKYALDATLLFAVADGDQAYVSVTGDGVVVIGKSDNSLEIVTFNYSMGYPRYASYDNDGERRNVFDNLLDNRCTRTTLEIDGDGDLVKFDKVDSDPKGWSRTLSAKPEDTKFVALLSDGAESFYKKVVDATSITNQPIVLSDVIKPLMSFKNFGGRFVHRRLQKFIAECNDERNAKNGWRHSDDLSLGVLYFGA